MKVHVLIAAALALLFVASAARAQEEVKENLVANGSFEQTVPGKTIVVGLAGSKTEGKDKYPKGQMPLEVPALKAWGFQVWSPTVGKLSLDTDTAAEGKQSLKIVLKGKQASMTLRQSIGKVKPETTYTLGFKIKRSNPKQSIMVRIYRYPSGEAVTRTLRKFGPPDDNGWSEATYEVKTLEKTNRMLLVMAPWYTGDQESVVWLDDVRITE